MPGLFLRSLCRQLGWILNGLLPGRHAGAPLGARRLLFLLVICPLFLCYQLWHWACLFLDEVFFRGYRACVVEAPVFITGIPRSGTTFLHRTLASGSEQVFTTFTTWEAVLAPSVTERKLVWLLERIDHVAGSPAKRLLERLTARFAGDFNAIHAVDPGAPEEDYLCLLPAASCFILLLAFPYAPWLRSLAMFDTMAPGSQRELLLYYRRCLQRHLYCAPKGARLLSKNAAFGSWTGALRQAFPDARFILCVRTPERALSSQLSALRPARQLFATDPDGSLTARVFFGIFLHNYRQLAAFIATEREDQSAVVDLSDLAAAPAEVIREVIRRLDLPCSPGMERALAALRPAPGSNHHHAIATCGLDSAEVRTRIGAWHKKLLQGALRVKREPVQ